MHAIKLDQAGEMDLPNELPDGWLTAEAALAKLAVARQTLYAYVSRGLVRTRPAPDSLHRKLYDQRNIEALVERRTRSRARRAVAASTIDFGEPVLASAITRISDGALTYRGRDAIDLAETATLEETATLLWEAPYRVLPPSDHEPHDRDEPVEPLARCMREVAALPGSIIWGRHPAALLSDSASLLRRVTEGASNARASGALHETLATAWSADAAGAGLIRRALVLCADHELNTSAFAVRVVASTGAALPACVLAGLAALSGPLHGGMTERIGALLAEPGMKSAPHVALAARLARGERLPGFGHRLYPLGDPRATALLAATEPGQWWRDLFAAAKELTGLRPNIDMALVALQQSLRLPKGAALAIFASGRTAGWIAHALEQQRDGRLIRPRASYAGLS
jgi:citrate synthase